jgi:PAS domain-containing protein
MSVQRPLELILARNLLSSITTPAFLLGERGTLLYYNEAAAAMLGRGFEEGANMPADEWTRVFGPLDEDGRPLNYEQLPAVLTVRAQQPYHGTFRIRVAGGGERKVAASAIPVVGLGGSTGAIVFFWPVFKWADAETPEPARAPDAASTADSPPARDSPAPGARLARAHGARETEAGER